MNYFKLVLQGQNQPNTKARHRQKKKGKMIKTIEHTCPMKTNVKVFISHLIISIDGKKLLNKIEYYMKTKVLSELYMETTYLKVTRAMCENHTQCHTEWQNRKDSSKCGNSSKVYAFITTFTHVL